MKILGPSIPHVHSVLSRCSYRNKIKMKPWRMAWDDFPTKLLVLYIYISIYTPFFSAKMRLETGV